MTLPAACPEDTDGDGALQRALQQAQRLAAAGHWDAAAQRYRDVLAQAPDQAEAWEGLGLAALQGNRTTEGLTWLLGARARAPGNARVLASLGVAQRRSGLLDEAIASLRAAVALDPRPAHLINLARAEREAGQLPRAIETFQRALALDAGSADAWSMLSNALREAGRVEESRSAAREALARNPWLAEAHLNEGAALHRLGRVADAAVSYWVAGLRLPQPSAALANLHAALTEAEAKGTGHSVELAAVRRLLSAPHDAAVYASLARAERQKHRPATALACWERAAELAPKALTFVELAELCWELGQVRQAQVNGLRAFESRDADLACYRRFGLWLTRQPRFSLAAAGWQSIVERCPEDIPTLVNWGVALQRQGLPSSAASLQRRALRHDPGRIEALVNLGSALCDLGQFADANVAYRRALELAPSDARITSNLLFSLHFDPSVPAETVHAEHVAFGARFGATGPRDPRRFAQSRDPERRLRVGYVSPDFRWHPVAYFLEPVLAAHATNELEVYCYSDVERPDAVTARLSGLVPHFVACAGWSDAELAARIQAAQIDILVDLAGHTARNRLPVFALEPSPVQLSWLGYFDTTGLSAVDYRIADEHSVPSEAERFFVERVVRLPRSSNCFLPPPGPEPAEPPCLARGHITFGCFNNPAKLTRQGVATFGRILRELPGSRLVLQYGAFDDPQIAARFRQWLGEEGISNARLDLLGHSPLPRFLESFSRIDIALDPFPYSGETTALHTLWMGVPLVALEGTTLVQRLASRVLRVAGLSDWVACSEQEYVTIALSLARDPGRLARLRASLRTQLAASPLLDHTGVTREIEGLYRSLWRAWCRASRASG